MGDTGSISGKDRALTHSKRPLISSGTLRLEISQLIPEERNVSKGKVESYPSTRRHPVLRPTSPWGEQSCKLATGRGDRAHSENRALVLARKHLGLSTSSNQDNFVTVSDAYDGSRGVSPPFPTSGGAWPCAGSETASSTSSLPLTLT